MSYTHISFNHSNNIPILSLYNPCSICTIRDLFKMYKHWHKNNSIFFKPIVYGLSISPSAFFGVFIEWRCILKRRRRFEQRAIRMTNWLKSKYYCQNFLPFFSLFFKIEIYYVIFSYYVMDNLKPNFQIPWPQFSIAWWLFLPISVWLGYP